MSKRSGSGTSQERSPKKKRGLISADQSRLDLYFSNPTNGHPGREGTDRKKEPQLRLAKPGEGPHNTEIIDVDLDEDASPTVASGSPAPACRPSSPRRTLKVNVPEIVVSDIEYSSLTTDSLTFRSETPQLQAGHAVPYSFLAHALSELSSTRSRISILNILTNAIRVIIECHSPSLLPAIYLLSNTLSPPYSSVELGLGPSVISKAIQHVSGLSSAALKRLYTSTGDVGDVAFQAKSKVRTLVPHPSLTAPVVYSTLLQISKCAGQGAAAKKQGLVERLLVSAKGEEVRYLVRTLSQNLRVGAVRTSIFIALARAMVLVKPSSALYSSEHCIDPTRLKRANIDKKNKKASTAKDTVNEAFKAAEGLIRRVYAQHPSYDDIINALLESGLEGLSAKVPLTVGIPLHPTLGSPARSLSEVYKLLNGREFTAEYKYDGQRAQIHASKLVDDTVNVHIFSRHLEDMTTKASLEYPDIIALVEVFFSTRPELRSFIMDSEVVAINPQNGSLKTFQELSYRARKDVLIKDVEVQVGVFAFDLMFLDGEILLSRPLRERRALLHLNFAPRTPQEQSVARFDHVASCESNSGKENVEEFWEKAIESRCEGLMIKVLDNEGQPDVSVPTRKKPLPATYEPDKRTTAWLKLKKDYVDGLGDSLDLIPIGAWHGNGRKAAWWSPILLGVWDTESGRVVAVCKCMSGFSDQFYKEFTERYRLHEQPSVCSDRPAWACDMGGYRPDVYFKPQEVWEIRGADITISPTSVAALGLANPSRGLSLRFPRFIKVREDKSVMQASTPQFLADLWKKQDDRGFEDVDDGLIDVDPSDDVAESEEESDDCNSKGLR
ncbi:ATP-dependent DNA ligase [Pleurotus eryngii]|uniref:DNA ligase n=1 Tax=Pleurotus eryngii TaxID=5323 RepID=A0A9P6A8H4_PLEER|nr:ATP-dependent DNA ligase [Pleurotus eryngii]